jgi:hypothetical protein
MLALALAAIVCVAAADDHRVGDGWEWWCMGNCTWVDSPVAAAATGVTGVDLGYMLLGGGNDVDSAYIQMVDSAGAGGNFIVIRADPSDDHNAYIL